MTGRTTAEYWDAQAPRFDDEPDHGRRDPAARSGWADLLLPRLPGAAAVVDLGCGTGTLAVLLGQAGHRVRGVDLAPRMVEAARAKAIDAGTCCGRCATPTRRCAGIEDERFLLTSPC